MFLAGATNVVFPVIDGKEGLSISEQTAHCYHTTNMNIDGALNDVLSSIFSSVTGNEYDT